MPEPLTVYVPGHDSVERRLLAPGCAMVGELGLVDLEDNRYGRDRPYGNVDVYVDCLRRAAGRHVERYPTVARVMLPEDELIVVGRWHPEDTELGTPALRAMSGLGRLEVTDAGELETWCGFDLFDGAPWRRP
jgi:hypothetical protein